MVARFGTCKTSGDCTRNERALQRSIKCLPFGQTLQKSDLDMAGKHRLVSEALLAILAYGSFSDWHALTLGGRG